MTWTPNEARRLARIAAKTAVPRQSAVEAVVRVGEGGALSVFGLRWDIAAAMLATFCAALVLHHGDLVGYVGRMGHVLDRPDAHKQVILGKALACRNAEAALLFGGKDAKAATDACAPTPDLIAHAGALGIHLLGDGRVLNDSQLAMLGPDEIEESAGQAFDPAPLLHKREPRPVNDLASSYPLPLHEAWLRLADGDLRRYMRRSQCGMLIHAHVSTQLDRSVVWSITSEGEERVRFTATLEPVDAQTTRVSLIDSIDRQPVGRLFDGDKKDETGRIVEDRIGEPVVYHPALPPPLRPAFAEAMSAMLEQRLFDFHRIHDEGAYQPGEGMTGGFCGSQYDRLRMQSRLASIHDPADRP